MRPHVASILLLAAALLSNPACAGVRAAGSADAATVEVRDASLEEILSALGERFALQHRSAVPLERRLTGTYEGPLQRVVRHLLDGYDFVVKSSFGMLEVSILGAAGRDGAAVPPAMGAIESARERRRRRE